MFKSFPQKQFHTLIQGADMRWMRRVCFRKVPLDSVWSNRKSPQQPSEAVPTPHLLAVVMDAWSKMKPLH